MVWGHSLGIEITTLTMQLVHSSYPVAYFYQVRVIFMRDCLSKKKQAILSLNINKTAFLKANILIKLFSLGKIFNKKTDAYKNLNI